MSKVIDISKYLITQPSPAEIKAFENFVAKENIAIKKEIIELIQSPEMAHAVTSSKRSNYELSKIRDGLENNMCNALGRVMF